MEKMINIEMLAWGLSHIAENHGFNACTDDYEEDGQMCVYGGCNVPTLADVKMLANDVHIPNDCVESSDFGIDVYITDEWMKKYANKPFKGDCFWKKNV